MAVSRQHIFAFAREKVAERVGFEPTALDESPVFKTGSLNHSDISPRLFNQRRVICYHSKRVLSSIKSWNPAQICQMISKPDQPYLMPVPPTLSSALSRQERRGLRRSFGAARKIPRFVLKFPPFYCKINRICSKQHPAVWRGGAYSEHDSHSVGGPQKPGPSCGPAPR